MEIGNRLYLTEWQDDNPLRSQLSDILSHVLCNCEKLNELSNSLNPSDSVPKMLLTVYTFASPILFVI